MSRRPLVSIVIPNYNGKTDLRNCLESLRKLKCHEKEVIVVDSGSTDGSALMVCEEFPEVKLITTKKIGIGEANNIGITSAKGDFIVFDLNSDDVVDEDWLTQLVKAFESSPGIGVVGGKRLLLGQDGILDSAGARINLLTGTVPAIGRGKKDSQKYSVTKEVDYVAVPMVKREVLDKIGLCDPEYYIYFEETDFCMRARKGGYKVLYVPSAVFWHRRSASIGEQNPRKHYYERRNRIRFMLKNFPLPLLILPVIFHASLMTFLYSLYFLFKTDFRYLQSEKKAMLWNHRNLRKTIQARYSVKIRRASVG